MNSVTRLISSVGPAADDCGEIPITPARYGELVRKVSQRVRSIGVRDFAAIRRGRPLLIDVREPAERRAGRIPGSVLVPRGLLEQRIEFVAPDSKTRLVCYCSDGSRSILAVESLRRLGYRRVQFLRGGFAAWRAAGLVSLSRQPSASPQRSIRKFPSAREDLFMADSQ